MSADNHCPTFTRQDCQKKKVGAKADAGKS